VSQPVSTLDIAATILDLVGAAPEAPSDGASILTPTDSGGHMRMAPFFADYGAQRFGVRDGCWTFQYEARSGQSQLFNVCEDPAELVDRSMREPARVAAYRDVWLGRSR
jgi:arylsulfatase A-like enzyme